VGRPSQRGVTGTTTPCWGGPCARGGHSVSLPVHRKSTGESNPRAVASWPRPPSSPIAPLARSPACPPGRDRGEGVDCRGCLAMAPMDPCQGVRSEAATPASPHAVGTMYPDGKGRTLRQLAPLPADGGAGAKLGGALLSLSATGPRCASRSWRQGAAPAHRPFVAQCAQAAGGLRTLISSAPGPGVGRRRRVFKL